MIGQWKVCCDWPLRQNTLGHSLLGHYWANSGHFYATQSTRITFIHFWDDNAEIINCVEYNVWYVDILKGGSSLDKNQAPACPKLSNMETNILPFCQDFLISIMTTCSQQLGDHSSAQGWSLSQANETAPTYVISGTPIPRRHISLSMLLFFNYF